MRITGETIDESAEQINTRLASYTLLTSDGTRIPNGRLRIACWEYEEAASDVQTIAQHFSGRPYGQNFYFGIASFESQIPLHALIDHGNYIYDLGDETSVLGKKELLIVDDVRRGLDNDGYDFTAIGNNIAGYMLLSIAAHHIGQEAAKFMMLNV